MGFFQEFKDFAMRGNVVDLAVGLIIGAEFGKIINSAVNDLIMPPIGKALGGVNFTDLKYSLGESGASMQLAKAKETALTATGEEATAAAAAIERATADVATFGETISINYGNFVQNVLNFLIIALAVFMVVKLMNSLKAEEEEEEVVEETPANEVLLGEIRDLLKK